MSGLLPSGAYHSWPLGLTMIRMSEPEPNRRDPT